MFGVVGFVVASVAVLGDYTLGAVIGRTRPLADNLATSFPSGHVFGSTVFFGFWGFLAIYYGLKRKFLVPVLALFAALILAVGPARIYDQAHWPSDVAGGVPSGRPLAHDNHSRLSATSWCSFVFYSGERFGNCSVAES